VRVFQSPDFSFFGLWTSRVCSSTQSLCFCSVRMQFWWGPTSTQLDHWNNSLFICSSYLGLHVLLSQIFVLMIERAEN